MCVCRERIKYLVMVILLFSNNMYLILYSSKFFEAENFHNFCNYMVITKILFKKILCFFSVLGMIAS